MGENSVVPQVEWRQQWKIPLQQLGAGVLATVNSEGSWFWSCLFFYVIALLVWTCRWGEGGEGEL